VGGRAVKASNRYLYGGGKGDERASVVRRFPGFCTCPDGGVVWK
jgi:hypothetical protein